MKFKIGDIVKSDLNKDDILMVIDELRENHDTDETYAICSNVFKTKSKPKEGVFYLVFAYSLDSLTLIQRF